MHNSVLKSGQLWLSQGLTTPDKHQHLDGEWREGNAQERERKKTRQDHSSCLQCRTETGFEGNKQTKKPKHQTELLE